MPLHAKLSLSAYVISGDRSANRPKQLWNDAFPVKTSQSAKNELDPAKNENRPKKRYTPFLHEGLQFLSDFFPTSQFWFDEKEQHCIYCNLYGKIGCLFPDNFFIDFSFTKYLSSMFPCMIKHHWVLLVLKLGDLCAWRKQKLYKKGTTTNIWIEKMHSTFKVGGFTSNLYWQFLIKLSGYFRSAVPHLYPLLPQELLKPGKEILTYLYLSININKIITTLNND